MQIFSEKEKVIDDELLTLVVSVLLYIFVCVNYCIKKM